MSEISTPPTGQNSGTVGAAAPISGGGRQQGETTQRKTHAQPEEKTSAETKNTPPPAVTLAPSVVGLARGEKIEGEIIGLDGDGHPILLTSRGRFALDPTAGLEAGMRASLVVTETGRVLRGDVIARNGKSVEPPIAVVLSLIQTRGLNLQENEVPAPTPTTTHYVQPSGHQQTSEDQNIPAISPHELLPQLLAGFIKQPVSQDFTHPAPPPSREADHYGHATAKLQAPLAALFANADQPKNEKNISAPAPNSAAIAIGEPITARALAPTTPTVDTQVTKDTAETVTQATTADTKPGAAPAPHIAQASTIVAPAIGEELTVAVIAVTKESALSPVAQPPKGTPLAMLADSGRVLTFSVIDAQPQNTGHIARPVDSNTPPAPYRLTLRHGPLTLALPAAAPLDVGTKLTLAMLDRPIHVPLTVAAKSSAEVSSPQTLESENDSQTAVNIKKETKIISEVKTDRREEVSSSNAPATSVTPSSSVTKTDVAQPLTTVGVAAASGFMTVAAYPIPLPRLQPQSWAALEGLTQTAQTASDTPLSAALNSARLPAPGSKLTNSALFFWRALGLGSAENWLTNAARESAIDQRLGRVWNALQRDLALLSEKHQSPATPGDWRASPLPLSTDQGIQLITFFARPWPPYSDEQRSSGDHAEDETANGTEFVLDVEFKQFGRLRLRGISQPQSLMVTLTSAHGLPYELCAQLREVYARALEAGGLTGALNFEVGLLGHDLPRPLAS